MFSQNSRRLIIGCLISILLCIALLEGLFRLLDPFGLERYMSDLALYYTYLEADDNLYILPNGEYHFGRWSARIHDGARFTASPATDCAIAFAGDSVTFGFGVNDSDVWVNRLALRFQNVTFINIGLPGYNVTDVIKRISRTPADGYVYLIFGNDAGLPLNPSAQSERRMYSALRRAVFWVFVPEAPFWVFAPETSGAEIPDFFLSNITALPENALLVGFEGDSLAASVQAHLIPIYQGRISRADPHADAQGNIEIADSIQPLIETYVASICHDK